MKKSFIVVDTNVDLLKKQFKHNGVEYYFADINDIELVEGGTYGNILRLLMKDGDVLYIAEKNINKFQSEYLQFMQEMIKREETSRRMGSKYHLKDMVEYEEYERENKKAKNE